MLVPDRPMNGPLLRKAPRSNKPASNFPVRTDPKGQITRVPNLAGCGGHPSSSRFTRDF
jgi:hypothetical protein